jgi:hypothetical protein
VRAALDPLHQKFEGNLDIGKIDAGLIGLAQGEIVWV